MAILTLGSIASKIVATAIYPIISRLYTPEQFGDYSVFYSCLFILAPLATLKYPVLIPLVKTKEEVSDIISLSCWISIVFCSLLVVLKSIIGFRYEFFPFLIASLLGASLNEIFVFWKTRKSSFGTLAILEISRSTAGSLAQITFGKTQTFINGLVAANVVHKLGLLPLLWSRSKSAIFRKIFAIRNTRKLFFVAKNSIDVPKYMLPSELMLVISNRVPVLVLASIYGKSVAGFYGMAIMLLALPLRMLGNSMSKIVYSKLKHYDPSDLEDLVRLKDFINRFRLFLVLVGSVICFIAFFSPFYIEIILGKQWVSTGTYLRVLSVPFALEICCIPFVAIFNYFKAENKLFILNFIKVLLLTIIFVMAKYLLLKINSTLLLISGCLLFYYLIYIMFINKLLGSIE